MFHHPADLYTALFSCIKKVALTTFTPRYRAVASSLRDRFQRGDYPVGEPLPSQPRLAREFGVSLATLRQALDVLRGEGWIQSEQGGSTRVVRPASWRVLLVEDDPAIRFVLQLAAVEARVESRAVSSAEEAVAEAQQTTFSVILVDVGLPDGDGVSVASELRRLQPSARLVFVTANPTQALRAVERGVRPVEILPKPFDLEEVIALLQRPS